MSLPVAGARRMYQAGTRILNCAQPLLLLGMRLYWGWQFFLTGQGKLMNIDRTAEFFGSIGIPFPLANAYAAGTVECVGGLLLAAGFCSRITVIPLILTAIAVDGGLHGVGDALNFNRQGLKVTQSPGTISVPGRKPVTYTQIEKVNIISVGSSPGIPLYLPVIHRTSP